MIDEPYWMFESAAEKTDQNSGRQKVILQQNAKYHIIWDKRLSQTNLTVYNFVYDDEGKYSCSASKPVMDATYIDSVYLSAIGLNIRVIRFVVIFVLCSLFCVLVCLFCYDF